MVVNENYVIALLGPTGSGKSSVANKLSKILPLELVCMDSMQVYSEIRIGNTAPTEHEKKEIPHHLFGDTSIREPYSAVDWLNEVKQVIGEIHRRQRIPILVGGTGLYYRLLIEGVSDVPQTPSKLRARLDERCRKKGLPFLYRLLRRLDPETARKVHHNDRQRVQRFLEIRLITGHSVMSFWGQGRKSAINCPVLTLGLSVPRYLLRQRIRARLNEMLCSGWLDEVIGLYKGGLRSDIEKRGPLGYQILFKMLDGDFHSIEQAIERIDIVTRKYAKRQMTWFQNISEIKWFNLQNDTGYHIEAMTQVIEEFMKNGSYIS